MKQIIGEYTHLNEQLVENDSIEDINELREFCHKFNIVSFNKGSLTSKEALKFLKKKMGYRENRNESTKTILFD